MYTFFQRDVWFTYKYQRGETMGGKIRSEKNTVFSVTLATWVRVNH